MNLDNKFLKLKKLFLVAWLAVVVSLTGPILKVVWGRGAALSNPVPVTTVSAASFEGSAVAPGSIASAFGTQLATGVVIANTIPLPTMLGNTSVTVKDSLGVIRQAELFFVSPGQINFLVSEQTAVGTAMVTVQSGDGTISMGNFEVNTVAPAIFSANADGLGVPAAVILRVKGDGTQIFEPVSVFDNGTSRFITKSIDLGPVTDQVFLILYASGIRKSADPNGDQNFNENVNVLIGGEQTSTLFAGAAPGFVGLDQINLALSRTLIGRGKVNVSLTATGGPASNLVEIEIAGAGGTSPPQVNGFNQPNALAGQTITIDGMGFSTVPGENLVRIAGTEAQVVSSTTSQLTIQVPYGVSTGSVSVSTPLGEGISTNILNIRTSVSGLIETTLRDPIPGIKVKVAGMAIETTSQSNGNFLLPDVPNGVQAIEIDTSTLPSNLPFPKITRKLVVQLNKDNPLSTPVQIQPATGPSVSVGGGGFSAVASKMTVKQAPGLISASVQTDGITFEVPDDVSALFPDGSTSGLLTLTKVLNSRTPIALPPGIFSSSIVQITPFGVALDPGGKLIFPNTDNLPAGSQASLYTLDIDPKSPTQGSFIMLGQVMVSADGQTIETSANAVKRTSFFFIAVPRQVTTIVGRVVDSDGTTPVRWALVRSRGQEGFTDGNGGFVLRNVPVISASDPVTVEASLLRPDGRVDRAERSGIMPLVNDNTIVSPDLKLASRNSNRPPSIISVNNLIMTEGGMLDSPFLASDPDPNQTLTIVATGAAFASIVRQETDYLLRLKPGGGTAGKYIVKLTASDGQGGSTEKDIALTVLANRPPVLSVPAIPILKSGQLLDVTLSATDPDAGQVLTFSATGLPQGATLTKDGPTTARLTWTPNGAQTGDFPVAFKVTDDGPTPLSDTINVIIKVTPVSDLSITKTDGSATYVPGGVTTYTIVITNNGPGNLSAVQVTDAKPPQISGWTWLCSGATGGAVDCDGVQNSSANFSDTVTIPAGSSLTYTVRSTIASSATGNLVNSASVTPPSGAVDSNPSNNSATDTDTPAPQADLTITKTDGTTTYVPGGATTYTIVVTNNGPSDVASAVVADAKPQQISGWTWICAQVTSGASDCNGSQSGSSDFTDTINLASGASITYSVAASTAQGATGNLVNTATVSLPAGIADPNPNNNSASDSDAPAPQADLSATKTDGAANYIPGGIRTYSIVVTNNGPSGVLNALVSDSKSPQIANWSWECSQSTGGASGCTGVTGSSVDFTNQVSLPAGSSITYTVQVSFRPNSIGNLVNSVSVVQPAGTADPNPNNNTATDIDTASLQGDLSITKTDNTDTYTPGSMTTYTIVVRNAGPSNVVGAVLTDAKPGQIDSWTWTCGQVSGGATGCDGVQSSQTNFTDTIDLPAGSSITYSAQALISLRATGSLVNKATIDQPASVTDPNPANNSATDTDSRTLLWEPSPGPEGGIIQALVSNGEVILAGTYSAGIFRSTNNGGSWQNVLPTCQVESLVRNSSAIFAGTYDCGILRSVDLGVTWSKLASAPAGSITAMAATDKDVFAGFFNGDVFQSSDSGESWKQLARPSQTQILALAFRNNALIAGTNGEGIFITENMGQSWSPLNNGLQSGQVYDFTAIITDIGTGFLAGTGTGVYLFSDRLLNWTPVNKGLENPMVLSLAVSGSILLAGTGSGVFISQDLGQNWFPLTSNDRINNYVLSMTVNAGLIFAGTYGAGVYRFIDGWNKSNKGLYGQFINALVARGNEIFAATEGGQVFKTGDDGKTWIDITSNLRVYSIYSMHQEAGELFIGTDFGVIRYLEGQGVWAEANTGISTFRILTIGSRNGVFFAGTGGTGIYRSVDGAKTWQPVNKGLANQTVFDLIAVGNNIFAATAGGVFISMDGGDNWTLSSKGINTPLVHSLIASGKFIVASASSGIYRTPDNGDNWEQVSGIGASCFAYLGSSLFAGTPANGVFLSLDEGKSWQPVNNGLLNLKINDFAANTAFLFAGTGASVFKTQNAF